MKKDRFFTWKTKTGCIRLLTLFLALILVFSFSARMVSTAGGTIKNVRVTFDSRGATVDGELYYPAGTSDADKLPAVLVAHGAAIGNTALKGMSEELARRGYVVLNTSAYNMGLSEQPISDENGYGEAQFGRGGTPHGLQDSIEFLRSLNFVDQTRIGIVGHSLGARRGGYVIGNDCGHYTFNDIMINILYDTFGQRFAEAEINEDADALATARLNADQLAHYNQLRDEAWQEYNTRVLALCLVGYSANDVPDTRAQTVEVAGHEVLRNCQANLGLLSGVYDFGHATYPNKDETKADWYTNGESIQPGMWYTIDDVTQTSAILGGMDNISVVNDQTLAQAIQSRSSRIFILTQESHAKNNFSVETNAEVVKYFQQVFSYNRGEFSSAAAKPLDPNNSIFMWRENLNLAAMISMILAVLALAGVLLHTTFFAPCVAEQRASATGFQKKWYWIFGGVGAVLAFITIWRVNGIFGFKLPYLEFLPFAEPWWYSLLFLAVTAGISLVLLALAWLRDRKTSGLENLKNLNVVMKVSTILKTILLGMVLICFAYLTLVVIEDLFNQDYRLWMATFTEMKIENWAYVWRFAILFLPCFLAIGSLTNYMVRQDIPEWLDTLLTVIINSVGVWVCCLVDIFFMFVLKSSFSSFISTYQMLIIIPITVYITRKSYKLTNSVWLGAALNALLLGWSICSGTGMNLDHYLPQTWASIFFSI